MKQLDSFYGFQGYFSAIFFGIFLILAFSLIAIPVRYVVHFYAFYGMSRTRRKKIVRALTKPKRVLLWYATKYNRCGHMWFALICYYLYCIGMLLFMYEYIGSVFFRYKFPHFPWAYFGSLAFYCAVLSLCSVLIPRRERKNKKVKIGSAKKRKVKAKGVDETDHGSNMF